MTGLMPIIICCAAIALLSTQAGGYFVGSGGFLTFTSKTRIGCIDGLRGYLALLVLIHHFVIWVQVEKLGGSWAPLRVNLLNNFGATSVAIFFMITGFLFYPKLKKREFFIQDWSVLLISRAFRIIPLVVVSFTAVYFIISCRTGKFYASDLPFKALQWISAWSQPDILGYDDSARVNAYVLWSLWYEWLFYCGILPCCALASLFINCRLPSWTIPILLLLTALFARQSPLTKLSLHGLQELPTYAPLFALGMIAFEIQKNGVMRRVLNSSLNDGFALFSLLWAMSRAPTPYPISQLVLVFFFFTSVCCGNSIFGLLRLSSSLVLGELSFSIYLFHGVVLNLLFVDGHRLISNMPVTYVFLLMPAAALATALLSGFTYAFIERPFIAEGNRLREWLSIEKKEYKS